MLKLFSRLVDSNEREIRRLEPLVTRINELEPEFTALSDAQLRARTDAFRARLREELGELLVRPEERAAAARPDGDDEGAADLDDEELGLIGANPTLLAERRKERRKRELRTIDAALEEILPEAFAAVREAMRRALGKRHYDVQLMGGIVLHRGAIAEMRTGEGKTFVAPLAAYLNGLTGRGVHVVTVNDYLAKRDAQWIGQVFWRLGMSVGSIQHDAAFLFDPEFPATDERLQDLRPVSRQEAYAADVTYGTNNEFGFDYLRDNLVVDLGQRSQRGHFFAVVDEVDNILIDEARTPLIISGPAEESADKYIQFARLVPRLKAEEDYIVDEKFRQVAITEAGTDKMERWLGVDNMFADDFSLARHLEQALKAQVLYQRDRDYVVKDDEVIIVDEFTGRLMPGRRWSEGLHQAVEAKEGVKIQSESRTLATITFQNYFRMYDKLSGMTGTAETEETEFYQIYGLEVSVIPTHRPVRRLDQADRIYKTRKEKHDAIIAEVERLHQLGWPILIGTVNVDVSETLSRQLKRRGLKHEVLNAKYHQREAEIVAQAGQKGAITIATNMAGRGTDIKLDKSLDLEQPEAGLNIIGTERHESRRIDRQLRGRSGRQGDPGQSIFFLSLEDDLMRLFGSDRIARWMDKSGAEEGEVITGGLVTRAIEQAQKRVELQNFQSRKRLLEYDDVMNQQREVLYSLRLFALERGEQLKAEAVRMIDTAIERHTANFLADAERPEEFDRDGLRESLMLQYLVQADEIKDAAATPDLDAVVVAARRAAEAAFRRKVEYLVEFGRKIGIPDVDAQVLSQVMLSVLDEKWKDHLYDLDQLRGSIHYRSYGQKDPLIEYKKEAYEMFEDLMRDIQGTFTERYLRVQVSAEGPPQRRQPSPPVATPERGTADELFPGAAPAPAAAAAAAGRGAGAAPPLRSSVGRLAPAAGAVPEVGRNDPCPCGSGKKYKKCHGAAA